MFSSIVARTFELARRWWVRTTVTLLVALTVSGLVFAAVLLQVVSELFDGDESLGATTIAALAVAGVLNLWMQLATVRAASGRHGPPAALVGAGIPALRALPLATLVALLHGLVALLGGGGWGALVVALVLSVPMIAALGELALVPGSWGIRGFFLLGLGRLPRNPPVYAACLLVLLLATVAGVALAGAELFLLTGGLDPADLGRHGLLGVVLQVPPVVVAGVLSASLVVATHEALVRAADRSWDDDDDEPWRPTAEYSPAVQQLVGESRQPVRRLSLPPRAERPGRVPGPGVLAVAGVELPVGRATRSVEAASLELTVGDGSPGDSSMHDDQLWVSRDPLPGLATPWKQLAAGFAETGLWPIAIPTAAGSGGIDWFEQPARREADTLDDATTLEDQLRVRLTESLDGTPLGSVDLLRRSHLARAQLAAGSGRRTDALSFAFADVGPARLGLAPARRPGDVLHAVAWPGAAAAGIPTDELSRIVASWEERYAALLVGVGDSSLVFAVLRPPSTLEEAVEVAAVHHALCADEAREWSTDRAAAEAFVDAPTWRLSWR